MKRFITALCATFAAFLVEAVEFEKLDIGSPAAVLRYAATNATEIGINSYQTLPNGTVVGLIIGAGSSKQEKFTTLEQFRAALDKYLADLIVLSRTASRYNPSLPIQFYAAGAHKEIYRKGGQNRIYYLNVLEIRGSETNLNDIRFNFPYNRVPLKFKKAVTRARLEVLDRKRFDLSYEGSLEYQYWDTNDGVSELIALGAEDGPGDVVIDSRYLTQGGPQGNLDVFLELTFSDGTTRHYNGNGDLTEARRLFIHSDGFLEILGALPGEELLIQSTTNLTTGEWYPEPEKAQTGNGQARRLRRSTPPSSEYGPIKYFRILLQ